MPSFFSRVLGDRAGPVFFDRFGEDVRYLSAASGIDDEQLRERHLVRAVVDRFPERLDEERRVILRIDATTIPRVIPRPLEGRDAVEIQAPGGKWVRYKVTRIVERTEYRWELECV